MGQAAADTGRPRHHVRERLWRAAPLIPVVLGLVMVAAGATRLVFPATVEPPAPLVFTSEADETIGVEPSMMPDVIGMAADDAQKALSDAGIDVTGLKIASAPYAAEAETVVGQSPSPLTRIDGRVEVTLTVAKAPVMPDIVGTSGQQATQRLQEFGVFVNIVESVTADAPDGTVLSSDPAPGEVITDQATLRVATPGDAVFLADLRAQDNSRAERPRLVTSNGQAFGHAVVLKPRGESEAYVDYALSKQAVLLLADIGLDDLASAGMATVTVKGDDGATLAETTVTRGETVPLRVDVSGVIRLVITTRSTDEMLSVVLGDPRVTGTSSNIDALVASVGR